MPTSTRQLITAFSALLIVMLITARPLSAQHLTATIASGSAPSAIAINPATNKIYVANCGSGCTGGNGNGSIKVIDGATDTVTTIADPHGINPVALAVNPKTNKVYVANAGSNNITIIDGATNLTTTVSADVYPAAVAINPVTNKIYIVNCIVCASGGSTPGSVTVLDGATNSTATVAVGIEPIAVVVNPVTNKIYVVDEQGNAVTVIDGATNATASIPVGKTPHGIAVNPVSNKIYVANGASNNVTVIDGATNATHVISAGSWPISVAVNPVSNEIYVANQNSANVTVIEGANDTTANLPVGSGPFGVAVNTTANRIYVTNYGSNSLTVIDGSTKSATALAVGSYPLSVAANAVTNKIYVANFKSNNISVIDGSSYATANAYVGGGAQAVAVNPGTNKIYVANSSTNNVSVIDGATGSTETVPLGGAPCGLAVNAVTNKIYVTGPGLTIIDGATNTTKFLPLSTQNCPVAVNTVTNKIYVVHQLNSYVDIIDGATNSIESVQGGGSAIAVNPVTNKVYIATDADAVLIIDGTTNAVTMIPAPAGSWAVDLNPITNKIYVASWVDSSVTVIDGMTNTTQTVPVDAGPYSLAVNAVSNKIYVAARNCGCVTVIDGATNSTTTVPGEAAPWAIAVNPVSNKIYVTNYAPSNPSNVTVIDGVTNQTQTLGEGINPYAVAVNPATNTAYVTYGYYATAIQEQSVQLNPLVTTITPLKNNETINRKPTFTFNVTSSFSPYTPVPQAVWYQLDTWQNRWLRASGAAPKFTASLSSLLLGTHILYAFATDGQDANSTGIAQQFIGNMAAYLFNVTLPATNTTLVSSLNPSNWSQSVQFTATVTPNPAATTIPTGMVRFYKQGSLLGSATLDSSGQGIYTTSTLPSGSNVITAEYGGDANFLGSPSPGLTQLVTAVPAVTLFPASISFGSQVVNTTSTIRTVSLTNSGVAPLAMNSVTTSGDFAISSNTCGSTVALGAKCVVSVRFTPTALGKRSGALIIADNALNSPQSVPLSGIGVLPVTLAPALVGFGAQALGTSSLQRKFTLNNYQTVALTNIALSVNGDFAISSTTCGPNLPAGSNCTVFVTFTPTQLGNRTGTLTVSDSATNTPQTSALQGTGVLQATLAPSIASYGRVAIGTTTAAKTFTLTNNLAVRLSGIMITITGDFTISATTCATSLAAKAKCTISVTFTPGASGTRTGNLSASDSASNSPQKSNLTGTGI